MIIQEQTTRWNCVPHAFATALNIPVETLLELIGHDGSEILAPDLPEPFCRRAFQVQELAVALWKLGYYVSSYDVEPLAIVDENHVYTVQYPNPDELFADIMHNSIGVGCGLIRGTNKTHAFAWDGTCCYDPTGFIYPLNRYELYSYHAVSKR